jgi:hypothetical protein
LFGRIILRFTLLNSIKKLFGAPVPSNFSLVEEMVHDIPLISSAENEILIAPLTEEEVFEPISRMEHNKAPGPDGFPAEFYQKIWEVTKFDLMALFNQLSGGDLPLYKLNFGMITISTQERGCGTDTTI